MLGKGGGWHMWQERQGKERRTRKEGRQGRKAGSEEYIERKAWGVRKIVTGQPKEWGYVERTVWGVRKNSWKEAWGVRNVLRGLECDENCDRTAWGVRICRKDSLRCEEKQWKGSLRSEDILKGQSEMWGKQWKGSLRSEECAERAWGVMKIVTGQLEEWGYVERIVWGVRN